MLDRRTLPLLLVLGAAGAAGVAAGTIDKALPYQYAMPGFDGKPVSIESALEQKTVTAWSYRAGRELDMAVAILDASGTWSQPVFLGRSDGLDQVQPSLTIDSAGNIYLAMATLPSYQVYVSVLAAGGTSWTVPVAVSVFGERATTPTVRVVSDRLVVAYRSRGSVVVRDLALYGGVGVDGVQDGPDILPPSANSGDSGDDGAGDNSDDGSGGMGPKKKK